MADSFFSLDVISPGEAVFRLGMAVLLGAMLGIERDAKRKPIDFRAFAIIALASCALAILAQELYEDFAAAQSVITVDLSKIIGGVLTGIGFLGAGAIIKQDNGQVIGTATGASIWASGAMGLMLGFGFYGLALTTFLLIALVLIGGALLSRFLQTDRD